MRACSPLIIDTSGMTQADFEGSFDLLLFSGNFGINLIRSELPASSLHLFLFSFPLPPPRLMQHPPNDFPQRNLYAAERSKSISVLYAASEFASMSRMQAEPYGFSLHRMANRLSPRHLQPTQAQVVLLPSWNSTHTIHPLVSR